MHKRKKIKKSVWIILVIVLCGLLAMGGILFINLRKLEVKFDQKDVNLNEEIYNTDFIKELKNGTVVTEKEKIPTDKLGKQEFKIEIKDKKGKIKEYSLEINIVDTEKPQITFTKELETKVGETIDLLSGVSVKDNSNEKIDVKYEGDFDINKVGKYELRYVAIDSSGNEAKENFTLNVVENTNNSTTNEKTNTNTNEKTNSNANTNTNTNSNTNNEVHFTTSKGFKGVTKNGITYIDGYLIVNKTYTLPSTYAPGLTQESLNAFYKMQAASKVEGLNVWLQSGYRSYDLQDKLYKNYVATTGQAAADTYSARPGHSEHQSGLAYDVNIINDTFADTPEAVWLANNCYKYGFILRYPKGKSNETGYKYEPWHFRYIGNVELATKLYNNGDWITLEDYFGITSEYSD